MPLVNFEWLDKPEKQENGDWLVAHARDKDDLTKIVDVCVTNDAVNYMIRKNSEN